MLLHDSLRYKCWADRRTLDAVAQIDEHRFPAAMAFARQQLNHMVRVEELFRARLLGEREPHATTNSDTVPGLEELERRLSASNDWLQAYAQSLAPDQRTEPIHFHFVDGQRGTLSRGEVLFHLVNHGTYHRGAVGHALDLADAPRPADTYTVFIHAVEPGRREER
jgi:uncharacterized damage-inducible protein DinB